MKLELDFQVILFYNYLYDNRNLGTIRYLHQLYVGVFKSVIPKKFLGAFMPTNSACAHKRIYMLKF